MKISDILNEADIDLSKTDYERVEDSPVGVTGQHVVTFEQSLETALRKLQQQLSDGYQLFSNKDYQKEHANFLSFLNEIPDADQPSLYFDQHSDGMKMIADELEIALDDIRFMLKDINTIRQFNDKKK